MKKPVIGIIGFGRFGKVLYRLLKDDFSVVIFDRNKSALKGTPLAKRTKISSTPEELYRTASVVFLAIPIGTFAHVVKTHQRFWKNHLLIDVLSVKIHPASLLRKATTDKNARALLTHPLFGPDSSKEGFRNLPIVMSQVSATKGEYAFWKRLFEKRGLRVIEMTPREHDRLAAVSQGITHFVGRMLNEVAFARTPIDTLGAKKLHEVVEQTCNDTWELFVNLQTYNPFTKLMRTRLGEAHDRLYNRLLPEHVKPGSAVFGIQGGEGSFNEAAILSYITRRRIARPDVRFLYTTEKVMARLHRGDIDYGLFAIHNSVGGIVDESIRAIARYRFKIAEEFSIPVRHFLMKRRDTPRASLRMVMAHPQALKQCRTTLATRYRSLRPVSGKGDFIDTARAAQALAQKKIPRTTAILGPEGLASLYGLEIIAKDLQDDPNNVTSFLLVTR